MKKKKETKMCPLNIVWYMCMNSANVCLKYFVNWLI